MEVLVETLKNKYKVEIELSRPRLHSVKPSEEPQMWNINIRNSLVDMASMDM